MSSIPRHTTRRLSRCYWRFEDRAHRALCLESRALSGARDDVDSLDSSNMIFELLLAGLVAAVVWLIFFRDDSDPVDQLPGPPRKPWIGNAWELLQTPADKFLDVLVDYTNKYGDRYVFKVFSLRVLHISGPSDVEVHILVNLLHGTSLISLENEGFQIKI
uniref:SFRICE_033114 n=1 Tax=Spodoptera frugiperda TaxID=7108 RepID=A0A2H1V4G4_SPOFR